MFNEETVRFLCVLLTSVLIFEAQLDHLHLDSKPQAMNGSFIQKRTIAVCNIYMVFSGNRSWPANLSIIKVGDYEPCSPRI